jgi:hypothetical protein
MHGQRRGRGTRQGLWGRVEAQHTAARGGGTGSQRARASTACLHCRMCIWVAMDGDRMCVAWAVGMHVGWDAGRNACMCSHGFVWSKKEGRSVRLIGGLRKRACSFSRPPQSADHVASPQHLCTCVCACCLAYIRFSVFGNCNPNEAESKDKAAICTHTHNSRMDDRNRWRIVPCCQMNDRDVREIDQNVAVTYKHICVDAHAFIHTCIHTSIHATIHTYIHTHMRTYMRT